ncbi:MAG TPA: DUF1573 domain-containing protein [Candidatus Binataceae bacterium]
MMRRIAVALTTVTIGVLIAAVMPDAAFSQSPDIPGINSAPPGSPQPKFIIENPLYDFGSTLEGQLVSHTFKIKNTGSGSLEIRGVKTSCGCTAASPTKNRLGPGEESEITVDFDTHFQKGHQVRTITAMTNDPDNPQAVMTMQGVVKQQVSATPDQLAFGDVRKGSEVTKQVVISDLVGTGNFSSGAITNSNSAIKVEQAKRTDGKPGLVLKVTVLKTMPVGTFDDNIKVLTNRVPANISVFGAVVGDLNVDPAQVSFGIVPRGQDVVRILKLSNQGTHEIKVLGISSTNVAVTASAEPVTPGKEYKITVMLRRGTPDGQLRGQLAIKTDDPEQTTLSVPFYAIVGQFRI